MLRTTTHSKPRRAIELLGDPFHVAVARGMYRQFSVPTMVVTQTPVGIRAVMEYCQLQIPVWDWEFCLTIPEISTGAREIPLWTKGMPITIHLSIVFVIVAHEIATDHVGKKRSITSSEYERLLLEFADKLKIALSK